MFACISHTYDDKSNGAANAVQFERIAPGHILPVAQTVAALGSIQGPHGVNVTCRVSVS